MKTRLIFNVVIIWFASFVIPQSALAKETKTFENTDDYTITLDIKVFMEGPFFNGQMTPFINVLGFLPLDQPYNTSPWFYEGTESVSVIPSFNIIDWVLVELLKPDPADLSNFTVISSKAGFVLNNGTVTDLDGISNLPIQSVDTSGFFVRINHRNHIAVISSDSLQKSNDIFSWDFTTGSGQALGGVFSQNQIAPGVWGMISGNGDGNDQIDNQDKNEVYVPEYNSFGYFNGDFDMDSQVTEDDIVVKWAPNVGKGSK